jgi:hypothetical protein
MAATRIGETLRLAIDGPGSVTLWQVPPSASIAAIFSCAVVAGITATNGSPSIRAK